MTKTRVQFDLSPERLAELDQLMAVCEFDTRKDLFNTALSFFEAAVEEARRGRDIAVVDEAAGSYSRLVLPALSRVARRHRTAEAGAPEARPSVAAHG